MKREDIINALHHLENAYEVDKWKLQGIELWPVVRIQFAFELLRQHESCYNVNPTTPPQKNDSLIKKSAKYLYYGTRNRFSPLTNYWKNLAAKKYYKQITSQKNIKYLFLGADSHRIKLRGKDYNRFFDPLIERSKITEYQLFEYSGYDRNKNYPNQTKTIDLNKALKGYSVYNTDNIHFKIPALEKTSIVFPNGQFDEIEKRFTDYLSKLSQGNFFKSLLLQFEFWDKYLQKHQITTIYTLCYYALQNFALFAAAKTNNVRTVEIQHGPQPATHPAFAKFSKMPKSGFNTLPDYFWCWDKESTLAIGKWAYPHAHKAVIGGHPWLEAWQANLFSFPTSSVNKPLILYALQTFPVDEAFPDYLTHAMKETSDFQWLIRLHPRMNNIQKDIEDLLEKRGTSNFEIHKADEYPLPHILTQISVNITYFSGTAIEASLMGKKTIILDERGLTFFPELVNRGEVIPILSKNHQALSEAIRAISNVKKTSETAHSQSTLSLHTFQSLNC